MLRSCTHIKCKYTSCTFFGVDSFSFSAIKRAFFVWNGIFGTWHFLTTALLFFINFTKRYYLRSCSCTRASTHGLVSSARAHLPNVFLAPDYQQTITARLGAVRLCISCVYANSFARHTLSNAKNSLLFITHRYYFRENSGEKWSMSIFGSKFVFCSVLNLDAMTFACCQLP